MQPSWKERPVTPTKLRFSSDGSLVRTLLLSVKAVREACNGLDTGDTTHTWLFWRG